MRKISLVVFISLFALQAFAKDNVFYFMKNQSSARAAGLAGAFMTVENDLSSIYYNPALLSLADDKNLHITFLKHVLDINSGQVTYSHEFENIGKFAVGVNYTNFGTFDYADENGTKNDQTFSANDLAFNINYTNELDPNFYYGLAIKFIYAGIEEASASALALDAGLVYKLDDGRTNFGLSVLNAGFQLSKMGNETSDIPLDIRLGASHRLKGLPLLINFGFHHLGDESESFLSRFKNLSIGGEFYLGKYVQIRLGYDNQIRSGLANTTSKGLTGFSAGAGIKGNSFNLDYGVSKYGSNATLHRFSLSLDI